MDGSGSVHKTLPVALGEEDEDETTMVVAIGFWPWLKGKFDLVLSRSHRLIIRFTL